MEIIIEIFTKDIPRSIEYYVETLDEFVLISSTTFSALLSYKKEKNILFSLTVKGENKRVNNISLQVPNANLLYEYIKAKNLEGCGILEGAYKFENQSITFLTAPPGDYFYIIDPDGNTIQFYDKYDERQSM